MKTAFRVTAKDVSEFIGKKSIFDKDLPLYMRYDQLLPNRPKDEHSYNWYSPTYSNAQAAKFVTELYKMITEVNASVNVLADKIELSYNNGLGKATIKRDIIIDKFLTPALTA